MAIDIGREAAIDHGRLALGGEVPTNNGRSLGRVFAALVHQRVVVAAVMAVGILLAAAVPRLVHPKYTATTSVLMVAEPAGGNPNVPSTATKPILSADLPSLATNATVLSRVRRDLGNTLTVDAIRSRIRAKAGLDSGILPVSYIDRTPEAAIRGANAVGAEITRFYREIATTRFDSLIQDLSTQLDGRQAQLTKLDAQLAASARAYPYVDVRPAGGGGDEVANSVYQRLIVLRSQRDEARATIEADVAAASSSGRLVGNAHPLAVRDLIESDPVYKNLRDQYAKDTASLERVQSYGSDRYPGLLELKETVAKERAAVETARRNASRANPASNPAYAAALDSEVKAQAQLASDQARLRTIDGELTTLHNQIGAGSIALNVARIRRDRDNAQAAYSTLATRLAMVIADRAEAASVGSVVVIDRAQAAQKTSMSSVMSIGILVLTLWLAITLAVMLENATRRFRDEMAVESVYGVPVIGKIPSAQRLTPSTAIALLLGTRGPKAFGTVDQS